jgi:uncharacterized protein (TIGR02145 family)
MKNPINKQSLFAMALLFLVLCVNQASGQSLSLFDIDISNFPTVRAKFYAFDGEGKQVTNLPTSDFELLENGVKRNITIVSCPTPKPPIAISSVLTIDVSGSMGGQRIENAKAASRAWVEGLQLGNSECAITTFNSGNNFIQDFTTDRNKLLYAIDGLSVGGGTNFDAGFINPMAGALLAVENGKHKRVVVFLTDGHAKGDESAIIQKANSINATVYCVAFGMQCPDILRNIATQTNGQWFEQLISKEQTEEIYRRILHIEQDSEPCEIEWESEKSCLTPDINVKLILNGSSSTSNYKSPDFTNVQLELIPSTVNFFYPIPDIKIDTTIIITAKNSDFIVSNIVSDNPAFTISPTNFILNEGESRELTVSYIPVDSGYVKAKFVLESDFCSFNYYLKGGWPGIQPMRRTLKLIEPNGGESFVVGSDTLITWDGIPDYEPVKIEYSTDNGLSWIVIEENAKGLSYRWQVPKTPSNDCLARVTARGVSNSLCFNPNIKICDQIWMGCNLDVEFYRNGEPIRHAESYQDWSDAGKKREGAWCYYNYDPANGEIYGKLYNWYAVNDPRGLAPVGWRVPLELEWSEMADCLGGETVAGGKLKSTGTLENGDGYWLSPNAGATNSSGFSALPAGYIDGRFNSINEYTIWWIAAQNNDDEAPSRALSRSVASMYRGVLVPKNFGYSVRCIKE